MTPGGGSGHFTPICVDPVAFPPYLQDMSEAVPAAAPRRAPNRVSGRLSWPLIAVTVVLGGLVALAGALWLQYGTAVFFEIVRAGIAACL